MMKNSSIGRSAGKTTFQGQQIANIPTEPGLYAWYYRPLAINEKTVKSVLSALIEQYSTASTRVNLRYGMTFVGNSSLKIEHGKAGQTIDDLINACVKEGREFFLEFFQSPFVQYFTRPIYIGIAKNLNARVYQQHFMQLGEVWEDSSPVSRLLSRGDKLSVQQVMKRLDLKHSFALEARVRSIAPRDLEAHIFRTDKLPTGIEDTEDEEGCGGAAARRALERILQLVADPICGRR